MMSRSGLSIVLAILSVAAWSQQPTLPSAGTEMIPTLQEAIYAATPGDVLFADHYRPPVKEFIRVDRPITLVGGRYHELFLEGPGQGRVFLRDAEILSESYSATMDHPGITVSGFDLLGVINSQVSASGEATYGVPRGSPALSVLDASTTLLLVGSTFRATIGGSHREFTCQASASGRAAVEAYGGVVYAWNSEFQGGGGILFWWDDSDPGPCPDGPLYEPPAPGGPGLIAGYLWHHGCSFVGGPGAYWYNWPSVGADGPGFIADWDEELPLFSSKAQPR